MFDPLQYKLLIVDDVIANVLLLKTILKKEGFTIVTAGNGVEALECMTREKPDLVLLDVMMPEMDGYEAAAHIRENPETAGIPIIFLTALNDTENIVKGFRVGGNDYLTKPFRKEELVTRVRFQLNLLQAERTVQKQQDELRQVIAARDKLYSVISHDLRAPIGSLKMMNNVVLAAMEDEPVGEEVKEMVRMINKTSEEVYGLLDNLLKWTKSRLGALKVARQPIRVRELFEDIRDVYAPIALQKSVSLEMEMPEDTEINVDIEMVKSIIRNLISNAVKFSYEGGTVRVSCAKREEGMEIRVSDQGKGIPVADQDKLLKENTHYTTFGTGNEKGSGLGLLLCRDFAELHGGKLWFESEEGKGTSFYVFLPS